MSDEQLELPVDWSTAKTQVSASKAGAEIRSGKGGYVGVGTVPPVVYHSNDSSSRTIRAYFETFEQRLSDLEDTVRQQLSDLMDILDDRIPKP